MIRCYDGIYSMYSCECLKASVISQHPQVQAMCSMQMLQTDVAIRKSHNSYMILCYRYLLSYRID